MTNYTKNGLLLLLIAEILAIFTTIFMYSFWFSFNPDTITPENFQNFFMVLIPAAIIGGIGGLLGLVGAILMLMGRKEFGEKHRQFIFYAVVVFCVGIVISVILVVGTMFMTFFSLSQLSGTSSDPSAAVDFILNSMNITTIITPITAALGGLVWIFGLYQLENKNGRIVLFAAYGIMVITACAVAISSRLIFGEWLSSVNFEDLLNASSLDPSSYSQLISSSSWIGITGILSLIGNTISNGLLAFALYIPYKRITSGELVPVSPVVDSSYHATGRKDRICPNCGRVIPFDANTCPYCGKKFESYL
jgi:hypothetical protein